MRVLCERCSFPSSLSALSSRWGPSDLSPQAWNYCLGCRPALRVKLLHTNKLLFKSKENWPCINTLAFKCSLFSLQVCLFLLVCSSQLGFTQIKGARFSNSSASHARTGCFNQRFCDIVFLRHQSWLLVNEWLRRTWRRVPPMGPQRRRPRRRLTEGGGLSVTLTDCRITSVFNICSSYLLRGWLLFEDII